jgi:hypothetical protein
MTPEQFYKLDRFKRLEILRFVAAEHGVESPEYVKLAALHGWLLNRANGIEKLRRPYL